jgi:hypothetical protein
MILGAFIFLFGMIAFNAGSQGSISQSGDGPIIAQVTINTLICAMTSAVTGLIYHRFIVDRSKKNWNYSSCVNGSFVGMVTPDSYILKLAIEFNSGFHRLPYAQDVINSSVAALLHWAFCPTSYIWPFRR